jgi:hypothetical protein
MNAQEIRDEWTEVLTESMKKIFTVSEAVQALQARGIYELAAQVAEVNEHLSKFNQEDNLGSIAIDIEKATRPQWVWLSSGGKAFVVDSREVTGVAPLDSSIGNDAPLVQIGMKGQPWSKSADGTVEEVCSKLNIPIGGK